MNYLLAKFDDPYGEDFFGCVRALSSRSGVPSPT